MARARWAISSLALLISCANPHADAAAHFDRAANLVTQGDWAASLQEFEEGCRLGSDEPTRAACREKERRLYAGRGAAGGPSEVATTVVASAASGAPSAAPDVALLSGAPQPNAYAVIVGVEHYAGLPPPLGARSDAERYARMAKQTLGVSDAHLHLDLDDRATKGTIDREIEWARSSVPRGGRIYFYFSGHGSPDPEGSAYLLPSDGDAKFLKQSALRVKDVVEALAQSPAKEVLVTLDSCFSGAGGRSVLPEGARPLVRVKEVDASSNVAVFTASSGSEISGPAMDHASGLFSSYVLQGVGHGLADANGDGLVSLQELSDWVTPRVARDALKDGRDQTPHLVVGGALGKAADFLLAWGLPAR